MPGYTKASREGEPRDAGYCNLDGTSAAETSLTTWSQAVAAHGTRVPPEPGACCVDACQV